MKYVLPMFPYPSGTLHMGHARVYTISDVVARYHGKKHKVIHPIGWDAFGLPAENAARERNLDPKQWTMNNIDQMRKQLKMLNISFDYNREITTCDPNYFKHTQFLFLELLKHNLAYRALSTVNYDPVDQTVLANEQVINGKSWRSGAKVEKRELRQWFFKTTHYADHLLQGLKSLDWPVQVKRIQQSWINKKTMWSFVADTNFGKQQVVSPYTVGQCTFAMGKNTEMKIWNPITKQQMPCIYSDIPNFRLCSPSLNQNDFEIAKKHGIPILGVDLDYGTKETSFGLRDWLVSRQRKWGTPIPIVYCLDCGMVPCSVPFIPQGNEKCPKCFKAAVAEQDTLDTFVDSSFYYLRFLDKLNPKLVSEKIQELMPVDLYIGGIEHANLHLLYARFMAKFIHDHVSPLPFNGEPFKRLLVQGLVHNATYRHPETQKIITEQEAKVLNILPTMEKMSKSKNNGISPQDLITKYGSDVVRAYIIFKAPPSNVLEWDHDSIKGIAKWLKKVESLIPQNELNEEDEDLDEFTTNISKKIEKEYKNLSLNVIPGHLMLLTKKLQKSKQTKSYKKSYLVLLSYLEPICPSLVEKIKNLV